MNDTEKQKIREELKNLKCVDGAMYFGSYENPCDCGDSGCINQQTFENAFEELNNYVLALLDKTIKSKLEAVEGDLIEQAEPYDNAKWHNNLSIETIKKIINKHK
jgi:hypothetical protein